MAILKGPCIFSGLIALFIEVVEALLLGLLIDILLLLDDVEGGVIGVILMVLSFAVGYLIDLIMAVHILYLIGSVSIVIISPHSQSIIIYYNQLIYLDYEIQ